MARLLPLLLLLLVAACAAPERVVLLDNADGHRSELVVTSGGGSAAVDRAGANAEEVRGASDALAAQADNLRGEVGKFLQTVRAA